MSKKLSEAEWREILRELLVEDIGATALSKKYGVPESTIRKRAKSAKSAEAISLSNQIVRVNNDFRVASEGTRALALSLAEKKQNLLEMISDVAESEAKNAIKLTAIKKIQVSEIDLACKDSPSPEKVAMIKVLGDCINSSLKPGFDFIDKVPEEKESGAREIIISEVRTTISKSDFENCGVTISMPAD